MKPKDWLIRANAQTSPMKLPDRALCLQRLARRCATALLLNACIATTVIAQTLTVTGPIPARNPPGTDVTAHNYPQFAAEPNFELSRRGYVEEEFFFSGTATSLRPRNLADAEVVSAGHPYKTRMIVRRPARAERFNGVVIVEWLNVTSGYNLDGNWQMSREYLTREGYAWVGVSAQRDGVQKPPHGLTTWSPQRYGTLDVTDSGKVGDDSLSYDIFSQAGRAVRENKRVLGGLEPTMLLATGISQSAARLAPYYSSVHPIHRVYDGFLLATGVQIAALEGSGGPFRSDLGTKLLRINTESEVALNLLPRHPDSDVMRSWEIAGSSHVDYWFMSLRKAMVDRDNLAPIPYTCDKQPLSHVDNKVVLNAGYHHLVNWVRTNQAPPVARPIDTRGAIPSLEIQRDANGIARGGIRLSSVDAPTAANTGANTGAAFCRLYGSHEPFSQEKLAALYPTHQAYVDAVREVAMRNVREGFVLKADADEIIRDAIASSIGTSSPQPIP